MVMPGQSAVEIKSVSPSIFDNGFLRGVVSLRWPYSSSQHKITIQLSDEDIRRRSDKGQIRLTFHGKAAIAIKDLPALVPLEISTSSDSAVFEKAGATSREADYNITFAGDVSIKHGDGTAEVYDSRPVAQDMTPAKVKRTWLTPELKRSVPSDELGLDESWFSADAPETKRKRYSSSFRFIDSTQVTPAKSPRQQVFGDENRSTSQTSSTSDPTPIKPTSTGNVPSSDRGFRFQTPKAPVRFDLAARSQPQASEPDQSAEDDTRFSTQLPSATQPSPPAPSNRDWQPSIDESQDQSSRPGSTQGDVPYATEQGTPRGGPQVHFSIGHHGSAPPTPRNVPLMSLESASEQEDLYRKLRASRPPKSEAGSSMVADEDDEAGNLADDPKPTILETQSRVQERILRRKISEDSIQADRPLHEQSDEEDFQGAGGNESKPDNTQGDHESNADVKPAATAQSTIAAYGNSVDGANSVMTGSALYDQPRLRETSPSMTERGAAVQESVFRSKIRSSDDGDGHSDESVRSVKSSIFVEPAAASVDGSIHENVEETMLDRQASVQETLFREKLDRPDLGELEGGNLSIIGQAHAPSSNAGTELVNEEPTMMQQQRDVQENIFRDKVENHRQNDSQRAGPASLDHMEVNETADSAELLRNRELDMSVAAIGSDGDAREDQRRAPLSTYTAGSIRTIEEFHEKADVEQATEAPVEDLTDGTVAKTFLEMKVEAEPEGTLHESKNKDIARDKSTRMSAGMSRSGERPSEAEQSVSSPVAVGSEVGERALGQDDFTGHDSNHLMVQLDHANGIHLSQPLVQEIAFSAVTSPKDDAEDDHDDGHTDSIYLDTQDLQVVHDMINENIETEDQDYYEVQYEDDDSILEYPASETVLQEHYSQVLFDDSGGNLSTNVEHSLDVAPSLVQILNDNELPLVGSEEAEMETGEMEYEELERLETQSRTDQNDPEPTEEQGNAEIDMSLPTSTIQVQSEMHIDPENIDTAQQTKHLPVPNGSNIGGAIQAPDDSAIADVTNKPDPIEILSSSDDDGEDEEDDDEDDEDSEATSALGDDTASDAENQASLEIPQKLSTADATLAPEVDSPHEETEDDITVPQNQLHTELAYHESISDLVYDRTVDVMGAVFHVSQSKTHGPDYAWTALLMQGSGHHCRVTIFRPYKSSLPKVNDGDVLLLRNFRVLSFSRTLYLRSQEDSSWGVLPGTDSGSETNSASFVVAGPPLEHSAAELTHAEALLLWWKKRGSRLQPARPTPRPQDALSAITANSFCNVEGIVVRKPSSMITPFTIHISEDRKTKATETAPDEAVDPTVVFPIELRLQDARYAHNKLRVGDLVSCANVLGRVDEDGGLYGTIEPELSGKPSVRKIVM